MPLSDADLYYYPKRAGLKRTANPSGMLLNPLDLLHHPKPWFTANTGHAKANPVKKTFIFADHSFHNRTDKDDVFKGLEELKQKGFQVLILTEAGRLKEWNAKKPDDLPHYPANFLTQYSEEAIYKLALAQHQISASHLTIMHHVNNHKFDKDVQGINIIDLSHFKDIDEVRALMQTVPREQYRLKISASDQYKIAAELNESNNLTFSYENQDFSLLFEGSIPLRKLASVKLANSDITCENLTKLLQAAPHLELLDLSGCANISDLDLPLNVTLNSLRTLNLSATPIVAAGIKKLLQVAPNLETMDLSRCKKVSFLDLGANAILNSLRILDLAGTGIAGAGLKKMLQAAPNLETINLSDNKNISDLELDPNTLSSLKTIYFRSSVITQGLKKLLQAAPNLETLDLSYCKNISNLDLESNALSRLRKLEVSGPHAGFPQLNMLVHAAPNLERIDLSFSGIINPLYFLDGKVLDSLKTIDLSGSFVRLLPSSYMLGRLNLETMNLSGCKNLDPSLQKHFTNREELVTALENAERKSPATLPLSYSGGTAILPAGPSNQQAAQPAVQNAPNPATDQKSENVSKPASNNQSSCNPAHPKSISVDPENLNNQENPNKELYYQEYFPGISPSKYRLAIYQPNTKEFVNGKLSYDAVPSTFKPFDLERSEIKDETSFTMKAGVKAVTVSQGKEIILPSLDAEEHLKDIEIVNWWEEKIPFTLEYCAVTRFYKVKLNKAEDCTIRFTLAVPPESIILLPEILKKQKEFQSYKPQKKMLQSHFDSPQDIIQYVNEHKTGSCVERSLAAYDYFKRFYQEIYGEHSVRLVTNDVHHNLEIRKPGIWSREVWHRLELGGYRRKFIKVSTHSDVDSKALSDQVEELSVGLAAARKMEEPVAQVTSAPKSLPAEIKNPAVSVPSFIPKTKKRRRQPVVEAKAIPPLQACTPEQAYAKKLALFTADSEMAVQTLLQSLLQHGTDVFIAHNPQDVSIRGTNLSAEGKFEEQQTRFSKWLQGRERGIIYIDLRELELNEIAQLNDLFDGWIGSEKLKPGISIKLLDSPHRNYGPDFRRRVQFKTDLPQVNAKTLLPLATEEKLASEHAFEIDLFDSPFWQRFLTGQWEMAAKPDSHRLALSWKKGFLLTVLAAGKKKIIFKNPPLQDSTFTSFLAEVQGLRAIEWADQKTFIPADLEFFRSEGYYWKKLASNVCFVPLDLEIQKESIPILSNHTILSFVQEIYYKFSPVHGYLAPHEGLLKQCKDKTLQIRCGMSLSEGVLAEFLTMAAQYNVNVQFIAPALNYIPKVLHRFLIAKSNEEKVDKPRKILSSQVTVELHEDLDYAAQKLLLETPGAQLFDLSCLSSAELSYYPEIKDANESLRRGEFEMHGRLSGLLAKLINKETVILTGPLPEEAYDVFVELSQGLIGGEPFLGKLIILTTDANADFVTYLTGMRSELQKVSVDEKSKLLQKLFDRNFEEKSLPVAVQGKSFARLWAEGVQHKVNSLKLKAIADKVQMDEERSCLFDQERLLTIKQALAMNPWLMLFGATGVGKSYFLEHQLQKDPTFPCEIFYDLEKWLTHKPPAGCKALLVVDKAGSASELSGLGENFLERFKNLRNNPRDFFWQGLDYNLTPEHQVIFICKEDKDKKTGFLHDQALKVEFAQLPDFYVRARIIKPLLLAANLRLTNDEINAIAKPILDVYNWLQVNSPDGKVLITPRQINLMINLLVNEIKCRGIISRADYIYLATGIAELVGRQCVNGFENLSDRFDEKFDCEFNLQEKKSFPAFLLPHQKELYQLTDAILEVRKDCLSSQRNLGINGLILEGESGIGKSYFLKKLLDEYKQKNPDQKIYWASAEMSYAEKERLIMQASFEGAFIAAEEMNTSEWPPEALHNFFTGRGFWFATQNPASFLGRSETDSDLRHCCLKYRLDEWPRYTEALSQQRAAGKSHAFFRPQQQSSIIQEDAGANALAQFAKTP